VGVEEGAFRLQTPETPGKSTKEIIPRKEEREERSFSKETGKEREGGDVSIQGWVRTSSGRPKGVSIRQ